MRRAPLMVVLGAQVALRVVPATAQDKTGFVDETPVAAEPAGQTAGPAPYEQVREEALRLAQAGRFVEAAERLEALAPRYPEDFPSRLDAAFYRLRAADYPRAAAGYRAALALAPDHRDARRGLVDALSGSGDFRGALTESEPLVARHPEPAILDKHAYLFFQLGEYRQAEDLYRRAQAVDPGDRDARLGIAFCAQRLGRTDEARAGFEALIAEAPGVAMARQGLSLLPAALVVNPHLYGQGWWFGGTARRGTLWSITAGADVTVQGRYTLSADYRHFGDAGAPASASAGYSYAQDEAHLRLALDEKRWGIAVFGAVAAFPAWVFDSEATSRTFAGVAGAQGRWTHWGSYRAALLWSHYGDADLAQLDLSAELPVTRRFSLTAGGRAELAADGLRGAGRLEARLRGDRFFVAATAQVGSEWRPFDVDSHAIYNLNDLLLYGAEVRALVPALRWLDVYASAGWDRWRPITTTGDYDSLRLTVGLLATLSKEPHP